MSDTYPAGSITPAAINATIEHLQLRKQEYVGIPQGVLDDLKAFCRAETTCWHPDPRIHAALEGRREVWLRIQEHLTLTAEDLLVLYSKGELHADLLKGTEYARS